MPHPPEHKLRWYQYKLSSLFILMTLVALASGWYTNEMFKATERRKAIAEIEKLGGGVKYYGDPRIPDAGDPPRWYSWMRKLHGDEHLGNAVRIEFVEFDGFSQITDAGLVHLKGLTNLEQLSLVGTQVTDAGLVRLKGLTKLEILCLCGSQITDAGLVHLKGLTNLKILWLRNTQVTDTGLVHLKGLTKLERLRLDNTQITDAGLVHLKGLTSLKWLNLSNTLVTDAGLVNLKELTDLRGLYLSNTQITDAGLVNLRGLTKLEELRLWGTQVTDEGVKKLREALPNCLIRTYKPLPLTERHAPPTRTQTPLVSVQAKLVVYTDTDNTGLPRQ